MNSLPCVLLVFWAFAKAMRHERRKIVRPFSLREKDRMRGYNNQCFSFSNPLTPALSRRERELTGQQCNELIIEHLIEFVGVPNAVTRAIHNTGESQ
jgi:hypothetical protein